MGAAATASAGESGRVVDGAEHRGFYLGADLGIADYPSDASVDLGDTLLRAGEVNQSPFVFNLNAGYRFNRYFAWEVAWIDLNHVDAKLAGPGGSGSLEYSVKGPATSVLGILPFNQRWEAFVRGGVLFTDVDLTVEGATSVGTFGGRVTSDSTSLYWGLGLKYHLSDRWQAKFELNRYEVGERRTTGEATIGTASLGVAYRF
jgi:OmpA-OmpF porin, OOP family